MSLFRSDRMGFYNLVMPREYAWEVLNELGGLDCLQFIDQNSHETAFNRPYSNSIKRCEDIEAKIQTIEKAMKRFEINIDRCDDPKIFLYDLKTFLLTRNKAERTYFDDLEAFIDERAASISDHVKNYESLIENYHNLVEYRQVLIQTRPYIGDTDFRAQYAGENDETRAEISLRGNIRFSYLAGVINREDSLRFKKILFRVTRGMAWTALMDIAKPKKAENDHATFALDEASTETKEKTVFLIVYQGGSFDMMKAKLNKICEAFGASKYGIPEESQAFNKKIQEIDGQIREAQNVLNITQGTIKNMLTYFSKPRTQTISYSLIEENRLFVLKEKAIYHNLNTLKIKTTLYQGSCWCPEDASDKVRFNIAELKRRKPEIGGCDFKQANFPPHAQPPSHFRLNDFTWVFQEIVNTYGVPRYREINPGLFTIATFPFLFGVMFGDIGHGGLLLAFGAYLCLFKESIERDKKSMLATILPGRYLLLLQGFFAFYCGFIYNDFMAMPWNLFGSCYDNHGVKGGELVPKTNDCTYSVGIDPGWYGVPNELTFMNSFKMKSSIVLGVGQMLFGVLLRGFNNFHFNQWVEFFFEFVPMFVFLSLTFGYMAILIMIKWALPWGTPGYKISEAPSIINIFIKMLLAPGEWPTELGRPLYGDINGEYQAKLQLSFLIICAVCAFLILFPKPIIAWLKHTCGGGSNTHNGYAAHLDESMNEKLLDEDGQVIKKPEAPVASHGHGHGDHFDFSEVFVHQVIETIEFVLGSISNTASYLRLWALSLAHSQLAKVFYDNTIGAAIVSGNFLGAFIGFVFFAQVTFGILLCMDQMECFLHALRLHWVEFQNKFFKADGVAFTPLSFEKSLKVASE